MSGFGLDGSHGWASNLWSMMADGGVWGVPRCGLLFRKEEAAKQLVCFAVMPWEDGMPCSPQELSEAQDFDFIGVRDVFKSIGVEVVME